MSMQTRLASLITAIGADIKSLFNGKADLTGAAFTGDVSVSASGTTPALKVTQTGTGNALEVFDEAGDTTPVIVDAEGRLVVGSASAVPGYAGQLESLQLSGIGVAKSSIGVYCTSDTIAANVRQYRKAASGDGLVPPGAQLGANAWFAWDGTAYLRCAAITANVLGATSAGSIPTGLLFYTRSATSELERMRISPDGNLLINTGTDNLTDKLQVAGSVSATSIKLTAAPGAGKVLTSDAAGVGTWEALGTAATYDVGTSGNTVPLLDGANTWSGQQTASLNTHKQTPPVTPMHVVGADNNSARLVLDAHSNTAGNSANQVYRRSRGTAQAPTPVMSGDTLFTLATFGYGAAGYPTTNSAQIIVKATEDWSGSSKGASMSFGITPTGSASAPTERVLIDADGVTLLGNVKIPSSGTPGVGKVLTSDAAGVGTWQTPSGGGVTWSSTTLDFGTVPVYAKALTITDAAATTASKINIISAPTNDEAEMDAILPTAVCLVDGTITVYAHAVPGPVTGTRNFNYFLG